MKSAMRRLGIAALAAAAGWTTGASAQTIVVGGKSFTEQQLMTAMTVQLLKAQGFSPDRKAGMGSAAVRTAMENGQIDVYWEYTGTALSDWSISSMISVHPRITACAPRSTRRAITPR